jgi:hypothetical protein
MGVSYLKRCVEDDGFGEILCTVGFRTIDARMLRRVAIAERDLATHPRHASSRR